mgnify:CR=1 FL=1
MEWGLWTGADDIIGGYAMVDDVGTPSRCFKGKRFRKRSCQAGEYGTDGKCDSDEAKGHIDAVFYGTYLILVPQIWEYGNFSVRKLVFTM